MYCTTRISNYSDGPCSHTNGATLGPIVVIEIQFKIKVVGHSRELCVSFFVNIPTWAQLFILQSFSTKNRVQNFSDQVAW